MRQREAAMTQLFLTSLIAAVTLISGITAFYFNMFTKDPCKITVFLSYLFLAPIFIIIPIFFVIKSHRRDIRRFASYIHVFFEDTGYGLKWETAHDKWTDKKKEEGHDGVPWAYWALILVCLFLYFQSFLLSKVSFECSHVILPSILFIVMLYVHIVYVRSKHKYYRENLKLWREILRDLNTKPDT